MTFDVHVQALVGRVGTEVLTFTPGHSITVGTEADCVVTADGVRGVHGCLAYFDGELWALSSSVAEPIFVDKLPAIMWTAVPTGSLLSIGGARLRVAEGQPAVDVDLTELHRPSLRLRVPRYGSWMSV